MRSRFARSAAKVKALKIAPPPSIAQGGLAFLIAYTLAYFVFAR